MTPSPPRTAGAPPEVDLSAGTTVIGDLHLDVEREPELEPFLAWLDGLRVPRLVVLGDLFEFWIGAAQAETPGGRSVLGALGRRVAAGTAVDVVPGNRDFLLDRGFEEASGCRVRHGGLLGRLAGGRRALFVHGDELSTRDRGYQRLRRVLRSGAVRGLARRMPTPAAFAIARRLRRTSVQSVQRKAPERVALQEDACRALARDHGADVLVCGHAHRFRDQRLADGPHWLVVDAFGGERDALVVGADGGFVPCHSRDLGRAAGEGGR